MAQALIVVTEKPERLRRIEPLVVFALALPLLLGLSKGLGLTWDESIYFKFSDRIAQWLKNGADLSAEAVRGAWAYDTFANPHPPLFKILDALGAWLAAGWLTFPLDYRLAHLVYASGCLALVYWLLRAVASRIEAVTALAMMTLPPRVLGHLLLANTDGPVLISWLTAVVLAWRIGEFPPEQTPKHLRVLLILICAVAGATKFTGLLIVLPLGLYFVLRRRPRDVLVVAAGFLAALALTVGCSPDKWSDPGATVLQYVTYPFSRSAIPMATTYLGKVFPFYLPWHYFAVMSTVTFPVEVWLCLPGLFFSPPRWRALVRALALPIGFWLIVVHLPNTPRHDGVRQFVSVYPLLALLAWIGLMGFARRLAEEYPAARRLAAGAILIVPLLQILTLARAHPHELSYYNALIGGIRGAEAAGMETTYYFDALNDETLRALEEHVQPGQSLVMSPFWPELLESYRSHGRLRMDFKVVNYQEPSEWLLLYRRRHTVNDLDYQLVEPVYEVRYDGVSLLKLVRRGMAPPPG